MTGGLRKLTNNRVAPSTDAFEPLGVLDSTRRLTVAMTPKNAYSDPAVRAALLAKHRQAQEDKASNDAADPAASAGIEDNNCEPASAPEQPAT